MLHIQRHIPLAPYSTFQIGGPADFFVGVTTAGELTEALEYAKENNFPVFVFSGGSNILFADRGFRGLVVKLVNKTIHLTGNQIFVDAGAELMEVVHLACEHELSGMERLAGIPGSLGGAIRGNAGAFGMEIKGVVSTVKAYDRKTGQLREFHRDDCGFSYRSSRFKESPELVILSAVLTLQSGNREELLQVFNDTLAKREAKHPQKAKCAGSFFMNPKVENTELLKEFERDNGMSTRDGKLPAGWLIDHVGLRGKKIGGAQISNQHPNYFVNTGDARAEDVVMLASIAKERVRAELGVQLREEVQYVGF
ncbi:MAG: UDP-N-acetylmuramate dehydrogenase [Candidatus Moraniibacteriota bacterium]